MGMCENALRLTSNTNNPHKNEDRTQQIAKSIFMVEAETMMDLGLDKFAPKELKTAVGITKIVKKIHGVAQQVSNSDPQGVNQKIDNKVTDNMVKLNLEEEKIRKKALEKEQKPIDAIAPNSQSRVQNLQMKNDVPQQNNPRNLSKLNASVVQNNQQNRQQPKEQPKNQKEQISWLQDRSETPQIQQEGRQKRVFDSNLSNLQQKLKKQPAPYDINSKIEKIFQKEGNSRNDDKNDRLGSKFHQSHVPQQMNPQLSSNNLQNSKIRSFIGNDDVIADQGNTPIKGMMVSISKINIA